MESVFQQQHAKGGPLGPDGPDWPREDPDQGEGPRGMYAANLYAKHVCAMP